MTKSSMASTCSSIVGRFDGHGSPPVQYEAHCPMQHVQGYSESHWMPPLGHYLLCIAPTAARVTANKMTMKKFNKKTGHFDGRIGVPVLYCTHHLISLNATIG
jgi:hypothetical protein